MDTTQKNQHYGSFLTTRKNSATLCQATAANRTKVTMRNSVHIYPSLPADFRMPLDAKYYVIESDYGRTFVCHYNGACSVVKLLNHGKSNAYHFDVPYKKDADEVAVPSTEQAFRKALQELCDRFNDHADIC